MVVGQCLSAWGQLDLGLRMLETLIRLYLYCSIVHIGGRDFQKPLDAYLGHFTVMKVQVSHSS